jgi:hypothetical protein
LSAPAWLPPPPLPLAPAECRLCWLPLALAAATVALLLALGYGGGVLRRSACTGLQLPHFLPAAGHNSTDAVLPASYGGVHRYSIPGDLPKAPPATDTETPRSGVLHVYLKALKWPVRAEPPR